MRLLGYVYIGLHTFSVFEKENVKLDGDDVDGYCDREAHLVYIKAGIPRSRQVEVLVHELIHVAFYHSQMHYAGKLDEETTCTRLAPSLAEILQKNEWVSTFIIGKMQ